MKREDIRKQIGAEIRKIRRKLKLTQPEFVVKYNAMPPLDIRIGSHKNLSRYETGAGPISAEKLAKIKSMKKGA